MRCALSMQRRCGGTTSVVEFLDHRAYCVRVGRAGERIRYMRARRGKWVLPTTEGGLSLTLSFDKTRRVQRTSIHLALRTNFSQHYIMDQSLAKRTLQELIKREDLKNKTCIDCGNPNPQWASLRFVAISFCSFSVTRCLIGAVPPASPYLFACNALGFIEVSACTSGEFLYVQVVSLRAFSKPPVHSFVRSVSMDTWQEDQIRRMQVRQPTCSLGRSLQNFF